jgi:hypothetical protein
MGNLLAGWMGSGPGGTANLAYPDMRTKGFHARRGVELMVHWPCKHDVSLRLP